MNQKKCYAFLVFFVAFFLASCVGEVDTSAVDPSSAESVVLEVPVGSTAKSVGELLEREGIVRKKSDFVTYLKREGLTDKLMAGKYEFSKSMDLAKIAEKLVKGEIYSDTVEVLIPEGYEFSMIVDLLHEKTAIDRERFIQLANEAKFDQKFMQYVSDFDPSKGAKYRLEGFLFPAKYTFRRGADEREILNAMLDRFDQEITEEYYEALRKSPLNFEQIISLASIVEREGADHDEFSRIAGVFMNRHRKGMLFQSCATVQYIIEERKPVLSNKEIAIDNPYNTYLYPGLPPSPIACPGAVAIRAAFFPEEHDYFYFVVSGKDDGKHTFSKTFAEHEAARIRNMGKN